MIEQFLKFRGQLHHFALGEELSQRDTKGRAYGLQGCDGGNGVPLEDIRQSGLGKAARVRQTVSCPAPLRP